MVPPNQNEFDKTTSISRSRALCQNTVYPVPPEIDANIAALKLKSMGVQIDVLTAEQKKYLTSWEEGT